MTGRDDGSIFVEALVAAAVAGVILASTFAVISQSAARSRQVEARRTALMIARSELAAVGASIPLAAGALEGVEQDFVWRVDIRPCGEEGPRSVAGDLYCVSASVRPQSGGPPLAVLGARRLKAL